MWNMNMNKSLLLQSAFIGRFSFLWWSSKPFLKLTSSQLIRQVLVQTPIFQKEVHILTKIKKWSPHAIKDGIFFKAMVISRLVGKEVSNPPQRKELKKEEGLWSTTTPSEQHQVIFLFLEYVSIQDIIFIILLKPLLIH